MAKPTMTILASFFARSKLVKSEYEFFEAQKAISEFVPGKKDGEFL